MPLIDADKLKEAFAIPCYRWFSASSIYNIINAQPTAEAAPVRHGRWIDKPTGKYGQWQAWCSECGEKCGCGGAIESQHKMFCPNCGAKMNLEE